MFQRYLRILWHLTPLALIGAGVGLVLVDEAPGFGWALIVWGLGLGANMLAPASSNRSSGRGDRERTPAAHTACRSTAHRP
jgi:hypothetical protein